MDIKKQIAKEKAIRKRIIITSLLLMILVPYIISILKDQNIFQGLEVLLVNSYAIFIDAILAINIMRIVADNKFELAIKNDKIIVSDKLFGNPTVIDSDRIIHVEVYQKGSDDFNIMMILDRGKRPIPLPEFGLKYIRNHTEYKQLYHHLRSVRSGTKFNYYIIKKSGARKYYYLYLIYKNSYHAEFSKDALEKVKRFMREYNQA